MTTSSSPIAILAGVQPEPSVAQPEPSVAQVQLEPSVVQPHIYSLLDQRVVPHGKPLFALIISLIEGQTENPKYRQELDALVTSILGVWSADPDRCVYPQNVLAMEHFRLMNDRLPMYGEAFVLEQEAQLARCVAGIIARQKGWPIKIWDGQLLPITSVTPATAYNALNQRTLQAGFLIHDDLLAWLEPKRTEIASLKRNELWPMQLAQRFTRASTTEVPTRFQTIFAKFVQEIEQACGQSAAVVIQAAIIGSFAKSIRKMSPTTVE